MENSNMVSKKKQSALRVPLIALKIVAMWPLNTKNLVGQWLYKVYGWLSPVLLILCTIGLFLKLVSTVDLVDRSEAIDMFTLIFSAWYKELFFITHYNELNNLVIAVDAMDIPNDWLKYAPILATLHCICAFSTIVFWWFCPILKVILGETPKSEMRLPLNVYYWGASGWQFCVVYFFCCFCIQFAAQLYMAVDGFLFTIIYTVNGALKQLAKRLVNIRTIQSQGHESLYETRLKELKECVKTHAFILQFLKKLDLVFRSMIVADALHAIISLSFAMLQMSESKGILEWTKMVFFVAYCFLHQYLNSFFGQRLINKQEYLRYILEEIPWEESDTPMRRTTLIMMTITTKPIRLSAWRMYFLQHATFAEFVKNMISTYMVLRQLKDKITY